jgi:hypothetical protein
VLAPAGDRGEREAVGDRLAERRQVGQDAADRLVAAEEALDRSTRSPAT